jgi:hypothetical protein
MKISTLRTIIKEEIKNFKNKRHSVRESYLSSENYGDYDEDRDYDEPSMKSDESWKVVPKVGKSYRLGYRTQTFEASFKGWTIENGEPYMNWADLKNGDEWSAYIYDGVVSVGSSADPLLIHGEVV